MANNILAFSLADEYYGVPQLLKASEMNQPDGLALFTYLSNFYEVFKNLQLPEQPKKGFPDEAATKVTRPRHTKKRLQSSHTTDSWNTHTSSLRRNPPPRKSKEERKDKNLFLTEDDIVKKQENEPQEKFPTKLATPTFKKLGNTDSLQRKVKTIMIFLIYHKLSESCCFKSC